MVDVTDSQSFSQFCSMDLDDENLKFELKFDHYLEQF